MGVVLFEEVHWSVTVALACRPHGSQLRSSTATRDHRRKGAIVRPLIRLCFCTLFCVGFVAASQARAQTTLDFSSLGCASGGFVLLPAQLHFGAFVLSATNSQFGFGTVCADDPEHYVGRTALQLGSSFSSVVLTRANLQPFSFNSVGFAQVYFNTGWPSSGIPGPITGRGAVTFIGLTSSAAQVTQTLQFGHLGSPLLETLTLGPGFSDVVSVTWSGGQQNNDYFQFADVNVTAGPAVVTPEPSAVALLAIGLVTIFFVRGRRQRSARAR
jgi:hypothetical protein